MIRNLVVADVERFHAYRSDPEVTRFQGFEVMTMEEAENFITAQSGMEFGEPGCWVQYGVELRSSNYLIGDCAIRILDEDRDTAETGITISPIHQSQGYGSETMLGLLKYLFEEMGIRRVVELTDSENTASVTLLRKCGFREEAHFLESRFFKGKLCSEYQYAMLKREWDEKCH